jgi:hypothetical protein
MDLTVLNPAPPPPKQTASNSRRTLYIGLGSGGGLIAVLGVAMLTAIGVKGIKRAFEEPINALNLYNDCLIQQDLRNAYAIAAPEPRENTSFDQLVEFHKSVTDKYGPLKSVKQTFWNISTRNGTTSARIQAQLQFERESAPFEFVLRKENNVWRVFSYKVLS